MNIINHYYEEFRDWETDDLISYLSTTWRIASDITKEVVRIIRDVSVKNIFKYPISISRSENIDKNYKIELDIGDESVLFTIKDGVIKSTNSINSIDFAIITCNCTNRKHWIRNIGDLDKLELDSYNSLEHHTNVVNLWLLSKCKLSTETRSDKNNSIQIWYIVFEPIDGYIVPEADGKYLIEFDFKEKSLAPSVKIPLLPGLVLETKIGNVMIDQILENYDH